VGNPHGGARTKNRELEWNGAIFKVPERREAGRNLAGTGRKPTGAPGLDLRRLRRNRLIDLQKGHLPICQEIISRVSPLAQDCPWSFVQGVEHVDQFRAQLLDQSSAGRSADPRKRPETMAALLRACGPGFRTRATARATLPEVRGRGCQRLRRRKRAHRGLAFGFALCFFHYFFAQLALRR